MISIEEECRTAKALKNYHNDPKVCNNPNTGQFLRKGKQAGCIKEDGYRVIMIQGVRCFEHRLVWAIHNGLVPTGYVLDHKNGNRSDNRLENLRLATHSQNAINRKRTGTTSGTRGVMLHKATNKWLAKICINGTSKHLGVFSTKKEAVNARRLAETDLFKDFKPKEIGE